MRKDSPWIRIIAGGIISMMIATLGWGITAISDKASVEDLARAEGNVKALRKKHDDDMDKQDVRWSKVQRSLGRIEGALGTVKEK